MKNLQPIVWPAGAKQMDAWLAFLNDPERYKTLHDALKENVETLNESMAKRGIAGDIEAARTEATHALAEAKLQRAETEVEAEAAKAEQTDEQKRLSAVEMALNAREEDLKKQEATQAASADQAAEGRKKAAETLEAERAAVKRAMSEAHALQDEAQAKLDQIKDFKIAV